MYQFREKQANVFGTKETLSTLSKRINSLNSLKKKKKNSPKVFKYDVVLIRSIFHCSELSKLSITQDVLYNIYVFLIPQYYISH